MSGIKYELRGVTVEQFATLFEPTSDNIELDVSIPVFSNYADRSFAVAAHIQFTEDDKTFLVAEAMCHYQIDHKCWNELSVGGTKDVTLPKSLMDVLAGIAVSTVRGVVCVKTENTPFAKYFVPIVEIVGPDEGGDIVINKSCSTI